MGIYHHHWVLSIKDKGIWLINLAGGSYSIGIPGSFNYWGLSELKNWEPPLINHCSSQDTESPGMGWRRAYLVGGLVDYSKVPSGNRGWTLRGNFEGHCRNQPCIYIYMFTEEKELLVQQTFVFKVSNQLPEKSYLGGFSQWIWCWDLGSPILGNTPKNC